MSTPTGRPTLRDRTRDEVFALICGSQNVTRSALVELTGLPSSTIGHAVARLLAEGRITESAPPAKGPGSGSGRPGAILSPVASTTRIGAIDFGHRHFRVALGDDRGNVLDEATVPLNVDGSPTRGLDGAARRLRELCDRHGVAELARVVAGVPGPVEESTGRVCTNTILSNWAGMNPARELERRLGVPAVAGNDASLGAFGELHQGAGYGHRDFLYIKASHGIGAGLVVNGQLYQGGTGFAGEIGHITIAGRPELCRCGNRGCLEAVVSVPSVKEQLSHTHPHLDAETVDLALLDDPISARLLNETGRTLGAVLAGLCDLINPTVLIIGGELGSSGRSLIDGVRASVNRFAQPSTSSAVQVVPAALGRRAELVGALQLAGALARA
ncbi:MAG: ROK family protein [Propionicimonas sp.]|uniref:ROK family protein n=1 Tax=Propionicimonas sp. TaxID=1955623 RepID=UPI003D0995A3